MITEETVFILGAGASKPYNYPTGHELRLNICRNFVKDIKEYAGQIDELQLEKLVFEASKFTESFLNSSTPSIDLFLERNQNYSILGKIAIVINILKAEHNSNLHLDNDQDWYSYIFHRMTNDLTAPDSYNYFGSNKVTFITFNYDRSLEHFFYESLSNSFSSIPKENIVKQLKQIPICHVYGELDKLPWQEGKIKYKANKNFQTIMFMKDNIKIIQEREKEPIREIELALRNAKKIFFLGFGYAEENLEVLRIPNLINIDNKRTYGTALGLFDNEIDKIRRFLSEKYRNNASYTNPKIESCDCLTLLRKYLH